MWKLAKDITKGDRLDRKYNGHSYPETVTDVRVANDGTSILIWTDEKTWGYAPVSPARKVAVL